MNINTNRVMQIDANWSVVLNRNQEEYFNQPVISKSDLTFSRRQHPENTVPCYTAPAAGFSTPLGSNGNGGDESESRRKSNCLQVAVGLFCGLQDRKIFTVDFFSAVQIIT